MNDLGIELSSNVQNRHVKLLFWGATGTRKTESVLRNFPQVLTIDAEGNTDQCVDMVDVIPPFLRVKTKDTRKVMEVLDQVATGKIRFPDGSPVETVCIDSVSVLWSVQQEVAAVNAEKRAKRYNKNLDEATMTQLDWVIGKRPLKRIYARLSSSPIKYLVMIAREKDLYKEKEGSNELIKIGVQPDCMKGLDYDMNLVMHFLFDEGGKWKAEVTKVQGGLGRIFPHKSIHNEFPYAKLAEYAKKIVASETAEEDETEVAEKVVEHEEQLTQPKTQAELIKYARSYGLEPRNLGSILQGAGFKEFDPNKWEDMKAAIASHIMRSSHNV